MEINLDIKKRHISLFFLYKKLIIIQVVLFVSFFVAAQSATDSLINTTKPVPSIDISTTDSLSITNEKSIVNRKDFDYNSDNENFIITQEETDMASDSTFVENDTTQKSKSAIDAEVTYSSRDSTFWGGDKIYLYGDAAVNYKDIQLTAHYIELDFDKKTVFALGTKDSLGVEIELPVFTDKSGEYTMREVIYNFETEKALIKHVVTQQGEGYVISDLSKKNADDTFFIKDAKYTTCDNHDCPHFYIHITKGKMIPGDKTIAGFSYLVVEDVKLPLFVPFAFVPMSKPYSSGILMPSYGEESNRGFFLREGGYYFAFNDYFDFTLTGDIFTNLSWGVRASSQYKKRYKYGGNFNVQRITNVTSEKDLPDYRQTNDFSLTWSHRQDAKASQYSTFSASVNLSSSSFDQNNVTSVINTETLATSTKRSNVSYSYRFPRAPLNISANLMHSQNSRDTTIDLTIPDLTITMNRIYPFKSKNKIGSKESWYEKINLTYSGNMKNYIHSKESELMDQSLTKDWKNGIRHSIPISMNLKMLKYFTLTPNFTYNERWYFKSIMQDYDQELRRSVNTDTVTGFFRVYDYSYNLSTSTKLYTFLKPIPAIFGDKVNMFRHVMTPTIGFSYKPDFSDPKFGFYDWYEYFDPNSGEIVRRDYSFYEREVYGTASRGESGSLNFSLGNTLEMKLKSAKDTTGFAKISILESLNIGSSYNFLADSMKLSRITMSGRTKLLGTSITFGATFSPYALDSVFRGQRYVPQEVNKYQWNSDKGSIVRLESANLSFGLDFGSEKFKRKKDKDGNNAGEPPPDMNDDENDDDLPTSTQNIIIQEEGDEGYVKYEIPWNMNISYSMRYVQDMTSFNKERMSYNHKLTADINISGRITLTKKWNISISTGYNIENKEISHTSIGVTRDLHCWNMSFNLIPVGRYKSYFFNIGVNSSMLRDLKYDKRSSPRDNRYW